MTTIEWTDSACDETSCERVAAYQILTKRHARMRSLLSREDFEPRVREEARLMKYSGDPDPRMDDRNYRTWPLPNVWLGVSEYGFITVSHPPTDPKLRAWCNADVVHHPRPYLTRNQDIVDSVNLLLVVPSGPETDNPRSGTWATFRMAKNDAVDFEVIQP